MLSSINFCTAFYKYLCVPVFVVLLDSIKLVHLFFITFYINGNKMQDLKKSCGDSQTEQKYVSMDFQSHNLYPGVQIEAKAIMCFFVNKHDSKFVFNLWYYKIFSSELLCKWDYTENEKRYKLNNILHHDDHLLLVIILLYSK